MGNGGLDRSESRPYDSLQRTKILDGIRIKGERIEESELRLGTQKRRVANKRKTFCELAGNRKKWQI
jgi:hypothetical protein